MHRGIYRQRRRDVRNERRLRDKMQKKGKFSRAPARSYPPMSELGPIATEMQCPRCVRFYPPRPNSAHQETSQTCLIRGVVGFMRKIDERIEPLSPDKLRGIVPLSARRSE